MRSWYSINAKADDTTEVMLYDQIGAYGIQAKQFVADLNAIKTKTINLRINSYGGEVFDAVAICAAIKEHSATVVARIDGVAASSASLIAAACDQAVIDPSAFVMIHNPWSQAVGDADEMRREADLLDKLAEQFCAAYCAKCGKDPATVKAAMDDETWFNAAEAKDFGLVDSITAAGSDDDDEDDDDEDEQEEREEQARASMQLALVKFRNVPDQLRRMVASADRANRKKKTVSENPMPNNVIQRDGKSSVIAEGKEIEINLPAAKSQAEIDALIADGVTKGEAAERARRETFDSITSLAGLTGKVLEDFKKTFYGKPEAELRLLASYAVGNRARPVGEGSGDPEPAPKETNGVDPEVVASCTKRFAEDADWRKRMKCYSSDPNSAEYKNALERYLRAEEKCRKDQRATASAQAQAVNPDNDVIARLFKSSPSVFVTID